MLQRMVKASVERVVRRTRGANFKLDADLTILMLIALIEDQFICRFRAWELMLRRRLGINLQLGVEVRLNNF